MVKRGELGNEVLNRNTYGTMDFPIFQQATFDSRRVRELTNSRAVRWTILQAIHVVMIITNINE